MNKCPQFIPTADNMYVIAYPETPENGESFDFAAILAHSHNLEAREEIQRACNVRFEAFQRLMEWLPEDEELVLDWEQEENQAVLELVYATAIDHALAGDFDMATGMLELLLDMDPEDHLEGTKPLAYCYVALEEYELFDEISDDISDKFADKVILKMWSEWRRVGQIPAGEVIFFRRNFPLVYREFIADQHPITSEYLSDIESPRPSKEAAAREIWLQSEHLWVTFPEFIEALKSLAQESDKNAG